MVATSDWRNTMRASLLSLSLLIAGLVALFVPAESTFAAPKTTTTTKSVSTVNRTSLSQMRNTAAAANVALAKRQMRARHGGSLHYIQARNPNWSRTANMTSGQALVARQALRYQGLSAHIHSTSSGSFVHYGMTNWLTKGASTSSSAAHAAVAQLRALGLQARVVTRTIKP
jgi:Transglutaminase-like superfamily